MKRQRQQEGQALVFVALILSLLILLGLGGASIATKRDQRNEVEDALQSSTRALVQTFQFQAFAENSQSLRSEDELIALGRQLMTTNLQNTTGLAPGQTPQSVAQLVKWTILPNGGTCLDGFVAPAGVPTVCASLDAPLQDLVAFVPWNPHIVAVATLDRITN